jgi:putative transposase
MPRPPRIDLPGIPQHVVARGNNRTPIFFKDLDRNVYLRYLWESATSANCEVHAYVLMSNHVHLLVTGSKEGAVSRMMQGVGRRYARFVNRSYGRTGTLFEGRFKSSLVDNERYFLTCMRYIEMNPVRAGIVQDPERYRWSSFADNASGAPAGLVVAHFEYLRLGANRYSRAAAYRELFNHPIHDRDLTAIRDHCAKGRALGGDRFHARLEALLRRRTGIVRPGRPSRKIKMGSGYFSDEK